MSYYALFRIVPKYEPKSSYFSYLFSNSVEYIFSFIVYGEREDIEEFYEGKKYSLEPIEIVNKEGKLVNCEQKLPLNNLYRIRYPCFLDINYIIADNEKEAEYAYKLHCYSNLKNPVDEGPFTCLVRSEKVIRCIRKDGIVNIIV